MVEPVQADPPLPAKRDPIPEVASELVVIAGEPGKPRVVQYSDWRCPHCLQALPRVADAVRATGSTLVWRNFPLSAPCNPAIEGERDNRCELAYASVCMQNVGRFWDLVEALPGQQETLVERLAEDPEFRACVRDVETLRAVREQAESGTALELVGTPTFFVKRGEQWFAPQSADEVLALLQ